MCHSWSFVLQQPRGFARPGKLDQGGFKEKIKHENLPGTNPGLTKLKEIPPDPPSLTLVKAALMAAAGLAGTFGERLLTSEPFGPGN